MVDTQQKSQTSLGTLMSHGLFAQSRKITSCRFGKWYVWFNYTLLLLHTVYSILHCIVRICHVMVRSIAIGNLPRLSTNSEVGTLTGAWYTIAYTITIHNWIELWMVIVSKVFWKNPLCTCDVFYKLRNHLTPFDQSRWVHIVLIQF